MDAVSYTHLDVYKRQLLQSCSTGSEGGGVSSWGTSVFCLDRTADGRGVPAVLGCSSGGIAGGVSAGASAHIENVTVKDCKAGTLGGGLYIYSGSTTLYDCDVSGLSLIHISPAPCRPGSRRAAHAR